MYNNFELHIGFPTSEEQSAKDLLEILHRERQGWVHSEVYDVQCDPELTDPHNVPGTLGYLVSLDFRSRDRPDESEVLAEAQWVLSKISTLGIKDARLEIEFVFGHLAVTFGEGGQVQPNIKTFPAFSLPDEKLKFDNAERILKTPNSEIHFIIERERRRSSDTEESAIRAEQAHLILKGYGINILQTISYKSERMREAQIEDNKLICTAYYDSPDTAEFEAKRLINESDLFKEFAVRGYKLKLVLERILGCFKATVA